MKKQQRQAEPKPSADGGAGHLFSVTATPASLSTESSSLASFSSSSSSSAASPGSSSSAAAASVPARFPKLAVHTQEVRTPSTNHVDFSRTRAQNISIDTETLFSGSLRLWFIDQHIGPAAIQIGHACRFFLSLNSLLLSFAMLWSVVLPSHPLMCSFGLSMSLSPFLLSSLVQYFGCLIRCGCCCPSSPQSTVSRDDIYDSVLFILVLILIIHRIILFASMSSSHVIFHYTSLQCFCFSFFFCFKSIIGFSINSSLRFCAIFFPSSLFVNCYIFFIIILLL